jgi:hypothetical protein
MLKEKLNHDGTTNTTKISVENVFRLPGYS